MAKTHIQTYPTKNTQMPQTQNKDRAPQKRQVATVAVHQCKTVPCHHCHRPGFDLTNCSSSRRLQSPVKPHIGSTELTNGAFGRTWAGAEQNATFEETWCPYFLERCFWGRTSVFLFSKFNIYGWICVLENGKCMRMLHKTEKWVIHWANSVLMLPFFCIDFGRA